MKTLFQTILITIYSSLCIAQLQGDFNAKVGQNQSSAGVYGSVYSKLGYRYSDYWETSVASGIGYSNARKNIFEAVKIQQTLHHQIKDYLSSTDFFYQFSPYSPRLHDHNIVAVFNIQLKKWDISAGRIL